MRYYNIVIIDTATGAIAKRADGSPFVYTSFQNGRNLPGALNIELDVPVAGYDVPMGQSFIRIWGVPLQDIGQASNLNGQQIAVYAGMQKGLPLANPSQAGIIILGRIQQAFGNWVATNQTLDLQLAPPTGSPGLPKNIALNWVTGMPLSTALANTLKIAFPDYKISVNISSKLVQAFDEKGFYQSLTQLAQYVRQRTQAILGGTYQGVSIAIHGKQISVYDGTSQTMPKQISFADLIGQATWYAFNQISVNLVMRADLHLGDYIQLPPGQITVQAASYSQYRQGSAFQGIFQIDEMRHVGNFRQPNAEAWITTINCHTTPRV